MQPPWKSCSIILSHLYGKSFFYLMFSLIFIIMQTHRNETPTHFCELRTREQAMLWIQEISSCLSESAKTGLRKECGLNESPNPYDK